MSTQVAINIAAKKGMTPEKMIDLMLQNGFNVFILRWKKVHRFRTSYFGFDIMDFVLRETNPVMGASYRPIIEKGELFFEPDELGVPVGYLADTQSNRDTLAKNFYTSHYIIAGLITPSGTINATQVQADIMKLAEIHGVKEPPRTRVVGVYGQSVLVGKDKDHMKAPEPTKIPASKSVFGSDEKKEAVIPSKVAEEIKKILTPKECRDEADAKTEEKYAALINKIKVDQGKVWKKSRYYRDIVVAEADQLYVDLLSANGHDVEKVKAADAAEKKAEDAPPPAEAPKA